MFEKISKELEEYEIQLRRGGLISGSFFGGNLEKLIKLSGKKRADVAKDLDVSYSTLSNWILNDREPHYKIVNKVAEYFGKSDYEMISRLTPVYDRYYKEPVDYMVTLPPKTSMDKLFMDNYCYVKFTNNEYVLFDKRITHKMNEVVEVVYLDREMLQIGEVFNINNKLYLIKTDEKGNHNVEEPVDVDQIKGIIEFRVNFNV